MPALAAGVSDVINRENDRKISEVKTTERTEDVYDLSFVAYDKEFAEEFGLKKDYVTGMDKGVRWMEIRIVTEGQATGCYYNVILDKSVPVDFPDEDYTPTSFRYMPTLPVNFSSPIEKQKHRTALIKQYSEEEFLSYWNRTALATRDYDHARHTGAMLGTVSREHRILLDGSFRYISTWTNCLLDVNVLDHLDHVPQFWIAQADLDYPKLVNEPANAYLHIAIPQSIVIPAAGHMRSIKQQRYGTHQ